MTRLNSPRMPFRTPLLGMALCLCLSGCPAGGTSSPAAVRIIPQPPGNQAATPAASLMPGLPV